MAKNGNEYRDLERIAVRLFALATLADRISFLPRPLRFLVLWVMRPAEAATRMFILDLAQERGFWVAFPPPLAFENGDSRTDLMRLAMQFRALGDLLEDLLWSGLCNYAPVSGKLKPASEIGKSNRLIECLQGFLHTAINRPRWDSS